MVNSVAYCTQKNEDCVIIYTHTQTYVVGNQ